MRYVLKEFQEAASVRLLEHLLRSRSELEHGGGPQTVVLSSPTGSGKTVIMAALIEAVLTGGPYAAEASFTPDPASTFLWLSDRPDLNSQSRQRILDASDGLAPEALVILENDFDQSELDPGKLYFLNFGKLTSTALLTRSADGRNNVIWETLANTVQTRQHRLIVIMDEAHYGLQPNAEQRQLAMTIPQRFLIGSDELKIRAGRDREYVTRLPPMPIVIGISATPERFNRFLKGPAATRTTRSLDVSPSEVRLSGLIKDRIVLHPAGGPSTEWTMLREACATLKDMRARWASHADANRYDPIVPALLIQVGNSITSAAMAEIVRHLRATTGIPTLTEGQIVHCFGEGGNISAGDWIIPRIDPNEIARDKNIIVVLFKTALTTGWDCPRAEVLMSFRTSSERTPIAQLVGRMIRTPLAASVVGDENLNNVHLYLPNFDRKALGEIISALQAEREDGGAQIIEAGETTSLVLRPGAQAAFELLATLPSETVPQNMPMAEIKRLLKLARLLERDGVAEDQQEKEVGLLVSETEQWLAARLAEHPQIKDQIRQLGLVAVGRIEAAGRSVRDLGDEVVAASEADVQRIFRTAASRLAPELGSAWFSKRYDPEEPLWAKFEFIWISQSDTLRDLLSTSAAERFRSLIRKYDDRIQQLSAEQRAAYRALQLVGRQPQRTMLIPEQQVVFPVSTKAISMPGHLYVEEGTTDAFRTELNSWEGRIIKAELVREGFLSWLRNLPRKPWALSYAYDVSGGSKPGYPDFLIFRRDTTNNLRADILEPHRSEADSVAKAKGLALFAERYGESFGRIDLGIVENNSAIWLPMKDIGIRKRLLSDAVVTNEQLAACFADQKLAHRELLPSI